MQRLPPALLSFLLSGARLLLEVEKQQGWSPDAECSPGQEVHVVQSSLLGSVPAFALGR